MLDKNGDPSDACDMRCIKRKARYPRECSIAVSGKLALMLALVLGSLRCITALGAVQHHSTQVSGDIDAPSDNSSSSRDPLDAILRRAGTRRRELGYAPRGWWIDPFSAEDKLALTDALLREPLAIVPFSRTIAQAVRDYLEPGQVPETWVPRDVTVAAGYRGHNLYGLLQSIVSLRDRETYYFSTRLFNQETPLDQAILEVETYSHRQTVISTIDMSALHQRVYLDMRRNLHDRVAKIPPEVSKILGRLILDELSAEQWAERAFAGVPVEQRQAVFHVVDQPEFAALFLHGALSYEDFHSLELVSKSWDEYDLWFSALQCVEAVDLARHSLQSLSPDVVRHVPDFDWKSPLGWIRIRGVGGGDTDATGAWLIVDLSGHHHWRGEVGASSPTRLIGLALDLGGHNVYEAASATQGAGIGGIGILLDAVGSDRYEGDNYAQGAGLLGFGALINLGGDNIYRSARMSQGSAPFDGIGVLIGNEGSNILNVLNGGQGYGGPGGVGILAVRKGNNTYHAAPDMRQGWPGVGTVEGGSSSQAQGFGLGYLDLNPDSGHSLAGGLGMLINVEGGNSYVAGGWSQGTGYFYGTGILYSGGDKNSYRSGPFSQAAAAHLGIGALIEEGGNNVHLDEGPMALARDLSVALVLSNGGHNHYSAPLFGFASARAPLALFAAMGDGNVFTCGGFDSHATEGKVNSPGFAQYDPGFVSSPKGTGQLQGLDADVLPYFAYLRSYGLFLEVGRNTTYIKCGAAAPGAVWGNRPGEKNWAVHSIGVGMDVPGGSIDWRPLPMWDVQ